MQDVNWINDLKLRAGYGVTGNKMVYSRIRAWSFMACPVSIMTMVIGLHLIRFPECQPGFEMGVYGYVKHRFRFLFVQWPLGGTIEWYDKRTSDMLYTYKVPTPPYVYDRMQANVGDMKNTGIEVLLNLE